MENEDFDLDHIFNRMFLVAEMCTEDRETEAGLEGALDEICNGLIDINAWVFKTGILPVLWATYERKEAYGPE
jgi:hypothetical protein